MRNFAWLPILIAWLPVCSSAACFDEAAERYRLPPALLKAISRVESGGNPNAINCNNKNGSCDYGHMQINSGWLPVLQRYGIDQQALFNACTNTYVGAWILAQNVHRFGYGWKAVGAYNGVSPHKQARYASKVAAVLRQKGVL